MRQKLRFETPTVTDHGSIADHTYTRCGGAGPMPKDWRTFPPDKFGECSDGHAVS